MAVKQRRLGSGVAASGLLVVLLCGCAIVDRGINLGDGGAETTVTSDGPGLDDVAPVDAVVADRFDAGAVDATTSPDLPAVDAPAGLCERTCARIAAAPGCATDTPTCVTQCETLLSIVGGACRAQVTAFFTCGLTAPISCSGGMPQLSGCERQSAAVTDCLASPTDAGARDAAIDTPSDDALDASLPDALGDALDASLPDAIGDAGDASLPDAIGDAREVSVDAVVDVPSRAGAPCTMPDPSGGIDPACGDGDLVCLDTQSTPMCTGFCENSALQSIERAQCGGNGSTCLTSGEGSFAQSYCAAACRPAGTTVATGACRAGFVCTGWWYSHAMGTPDSTGCHGFCDADAQCPSMMRCHTRTGACGTEGVDVTRLPDGAPCNPRSVVMLPGEVRPRNIECRGICFSVSSASPTAGVCGSLMNLRVSTSCPDDPEHIAPRSPPGTDNLAVCIWRNCTSNADCRSPHICRYPEGVDMLPVTDLDPQCDYPTAAQRTGIAGDAGTPTDH